MASTSPTPRSLWTLNKVRALIPPRLEHISAQLQQGAPENMDSTTLIYARMDGEGEQQDQRAWIFAILNSDPVSEDEFDNENAIYRPPMFTVERVPDGDRREFGEHAYITQKHDDTDVWSLCSDRAFIQIGYSRGSITQDELWTIARKILEEA